ncbi:MAG: hypothetical protein KJ915_05600 [Candidatus Omnitrophica bacterium]|nr:hypothetical protein [Candidatus Omnitrophota bacterium]
MLNLKKYLIALIIILNLFITLPAFAGGLSSNWGEVHIDNLEVGKSYDLNDFLNTTFKIMNNFDKVILLNISIVKPELSELKPGYLVIEDTSWVQVKNEVIIPAQSQGVVPINISIPDSDEYKGKKYQFWIWTRTSGQAVGVGLKSRILISIVN